MEIAAGNIVQYTKEQNALKREVKTVDDGVKVIFLFVRLLSTLVTKEAVIHKQIVNCLKMWKISYIWDRVKY